ncbi:MAG: adenosine kinase, partial [Candidatus Pacearchaeota archaeon]
PGGSSANTIAGVSCLGGNSFLMGVVGKDDHGDIYEQKTKESGVKTKLSRKHDKITGHAITFITPDGERTFATHLGAAVHFRKQHLAEDAIKQSKILHIEGYQLEDISIKSAVLHAMKIAKKNNVLVSVDLSDSALVSRNLPHFKNVIKNYVDIVFANELEAKAFTGKEEIQALNVLSKFCRISIVKLGEKGSLIKANNKIYKINANKVSVVNTNGAGDMYAAGILYSISNNIPMERAGKIASYAASQVVSIEGARLQRSLKEEINTLK